jgi:hypothetical protein
MGPSKRSGPRFKGNEIYAALAFGGVLRCLGKGLLSLAERERRVGCHQKAARRSVVPTQSTTDESADAQGRLPRLPPALLRRLWLVEGLVEQCGEFVPDSHLTHNRRSSILKRQKQT